MELAENSFIYRYIASFDDLLEKDPYEAQKHFYSEGKDRNITFNPYIFLASNLHTFFEKGKKTYKPTSMCKIPLKVTYTCYGQSFVILNDHKIDTSTEDTIVSLYLKNRLKGNTLEKDSFDADSYYCQYHELIDIMEYDDNSLDQRAARFYIEYGYWYKLDMKPINGLRYIASFPHLIKELASNPDEGLKHYYNIREPHSKITFSPSLFLASNYEKLKHLIVSKCIDDNKVTKYYITKGCADNLSTRSFEPWTYLANNPKYIKELCVDTRNVSDLQLPKIFPSNVARIFLLHEGKDENSFDASEFVKMYIDDTDVNYDKKMTLENSAWYFCRGYVKTDVVRWRMTRKYKTLMFLRRRIADGMRQVPIHVGRIICFS
jgi:hypothetical protein